MDLFFSDLGVLTLADVQEFLAISSPESQRPGESVKIDYKLKEPANLCETVAAFANTSGGLIFIGVESQRLKQNVPLSLPGEAFGGGDVKARIMGKITSQVTPRPDVDIGVVLVSTPSTNVVVVIRIAEGLFPPYEYSVGDSTRIPVRLQDTNRQATLRDIERLFEKRTSFGVTPEQRLSELGLGDLNPAFILSMNDVLEDYEHSGAFHTWALRPRISLHLKLDRTFDSQARGSVGEWFKDTVVGNFYPPIVTGTSHILRWQARRATQDCETVTDVRMFEFTSDGGLRFSERTNRHQSGQESFSDFVIQSLRFLKFAKHFHESRGYFGSLSAMQQIVCQCDLNILPTFPDANARGLYQATNVVVFPGKSMGRLRRGTSRIVREIESLDRRSQGALVAELALFHLRQLCQASVDYERLLDLIQLLPETPGL